MSKILLKIGRLTRVSLIILGCLVFGLSGCRLGDKDRKIKELEQHQKPGGAKACAGESA